MKFGTGHVSYYINVGQTIGVIGGLILGYKAIRLEEAKAGIAKRPIHEVLIEDARRVKNWYYDNFGPYRQYPHY